MKKLIIIGAGGYAKSVLDSIDSKYEMCGFIDENTDKKEHLGYPVVSHSIDKLDNLDSYCYFIAIGNNLKRKRWFDILVSRNLHILTIVDKSAIVSPNAKLGIGCFIGKMAIINSNVTIEEDCIINTRALVEHGCSVSSHVNLSTNSVINGDVFVGEGSFVGSCSVTIGQKRIGKWSTIGAGAVVIHDVDDNVTVAGVPAKELKKGAMLG